MFSFELGPDAIAILLHLQELPLNINGNTINLRFRTSHKLYTFKDLTKEPSSKFQLSNKKLMYIIIDEILSLVGARLLHLIDKRCRDIFLNIDKSFAGIHVYMFG